MTKITVEDILKVIKAYLVFPYPKICRHYVICDLMSMLESKGWKNNYHLCNAVIEGEDQKALVLLKDLYNV